jgi:hypothetical protein
MNREREREGGRGGREGGRERGREGERDTEREGCVERDRREIWSDTGITVKGGSKGGMIEGDREKEKDRRGKESGGGRDKKGRVSVARGGRKAGREAEFAEEGWSGRGKKGEGGGGVACLLA